MKDGVPMPMFVSMLNWSGTPQPSPEDVRDAIRDDVTLPLRGLHSLVFLPDEGACAAVMVASSDDVRGVRRIARMILPWAHVRIESMRFDEPDAPAMVVEDSLPHPPYDYRRALLAAVTTGG